MSTSSRNGRGLSVLVVEDDADTADALAILLKLHGHSVTIARTGTAGLAAARECQPNVILLDIGLPELDGWEVARRIRLMTWDKEPFLVAITGFGQDHDLRQSAEVGIDLHLTKPVEPDVLMRLFDPIYRLTCATMPAAERRSFSSADFGLATMTVEGRSVHWWEYSHRVSHRVIANLEVIHRVADHCDSVRRAMRMFEPTRMRALSGPCSQVVSVRGA